MTLHQMGTATIRSYGYDGRLNSTYTTSSGPDDVRDGRDGSDSNTSASGFPPPRRSRRGGGACRARRLHGEVAGRSHRDGQRSDRDRVDGCRAGEETGRAEAAVAAATAG